jgi:protein-S-isoprenylcysteine O-methyltransferase Ste14
MKQSLELKIPPLVWMLTCALAMWAYSQRLPEYGFHLPHSRVIGGLLALTGCGVAISGVLTFRRASTTVNPVSPDKARSLVVEGAYQFTRNPMYLGMVLILLGWFAILQNLVCLIFVACFIVVIGEFQIRPEERALEDIFGLEYIEYKNQVFRWLGRRPRHVSRLQAPSPTLNAVQERPGRKMK